MGAVHTDESYLTSKKGILSWIITYDHKRIGLMYLVSVLFFFLVGGILALLLRAELWTGGKTFMEAKTYNQIFTLHGAIMVFLVIIPSIPASLGNFVLPLQLGAKDVAFPKLNLLSFYIYFFGSLLAVASIFFGAIDTGWTFYTPYSTSTDGKVVMMITAVFIMGFSSILTGLNFVVTIHRLRTKGLSWFRLPLFLWALYATSIIQIMATPVLAITLAMLAIERVFGIGIFDPALGGDPVLFQHFFWFYSHPAVYIMILPAMGIISELISTFSQKRIFGYKMIAFSSIAIAIISFLVWGHHMFVSGQSEFVGMIFSALTFLVAVPSGVKVFNWISTLYKGSIGLQTPMLYALSFLVLFAIGGLTGLFLGTLAVDVHLHDTYFIVAHFHYVMVGSTLISFIAGIYYWWPKMTGKMYSDYWGRIGCLTVFIGFNMTFLVQFIMGAQGMPRRYYQYLDQFQIYHQISTVGSFLLGAGFFIVLFNLLHSLVKGQEAPSNPWHALTLEWTHTGSTPIEHNFHEAPVVTHGPYDFDEPGVTHVHS